MTAAGRFVYIVDDEPEIREALSLLLSTAGVETEEYASAEGFWENAPHDKAYCVLLDNRLPGISGMELLARIVERSKAATVIVMTGHGDIPTAVQAMKLGAYHFTEKPFDAEILLGVVEDNGPGVAAEIADRLFEPFETTKPRGMGLGLPLAKEIAARHRGRLTWAPVAPHGARFELELPLA